MKKQTGTLGTVYRQGDVLIERVDKVPRAAVKQKKSKSIVLAHGTATGHHHVLESGEAIAWWKVGEISSDTQKPSQLAGEVFVTLKEPAKVVHPEHSAIELPAGNYRVTRQREYTPEAIRNVQD